MGKTYYFETYGCQMNEYDSLIAEQILGGASLVKVPVPDEADYIFINTCSVRENAHQKVYNRLRSLQHLHKTGTKIGILGCMAQTIGNELFTKNLPIDFVLGPDALRNLKNIVEVDSSQSHTDKSKTETYNDIIPSIDLHTGVQKDTLSANVAIQRGCDNFCSFCIVPHTRGRERSRPPESIVQEVKALSEAGMKSVVLLGQNVNSYKHEETSFTNLIEQILNDTNIFRIYFSSPYPKDFPDELIHLIATNTRMGSWIHLPLQSGSNDILTKMRRDYTKEEFIELCMKIRSLIPDIRLTTDIIVGFPTETEEQFQETLEVMEICNFDSAFMFAYSERPHTGAATNFTDDISPEIKQSRLEKVIGAQLERSRISNESYKGKKVSVMVEGISKRRASDLTGTMLNGKKVIAPIPEYTAMINILGSEINVEITSATSLSLIGKVISDV